MKKPLPQYVRTPASLSPSSGDPVSGATPARSLGRRSFLRNVGLAAATAGPVGAILMADSRAKADDGSRRLTQGDAAILNFLAAAEILESDLWEQYWELGGNQTPDFASPNPATGTKPTPTGGNPLYTSALTILDGDMPQYIQDNTDDEFSHANFLLAYLKSKGADTEDLDLLLDPDHHHFRTLKGSTATGAKNKGRLTNLKQLSVDTSFWTRYRSDAHNPDLPDGFTFPQAVQGLNVGEHPAIPRTDADTAGSTITTAPENGITPHLKVIAFAAGFHFAFIEQGGTGLYPALAQRVTDPEALRVVLSIGPTEAMHFQTWQDKAGNALPVSSDGVTFADLKASTEELLQANLIMPEPCPFLSGKFPICSIVRPTNTQGAAMGAVNALIADGLFIGQTKDFFELLKDLASDADAARRGY
jgi:hypothetical protein